jgi:hypothetical protein
MLKELKSLPRIRILLKAWLKILLLKIKLLKGVILEDGTKYYCDAVNFNDWNIFKR